MECEGVPTAKMVKFCLGIIEITADA